MAEEEAPGPSGGSFIDSYEYDAFGNAWTVSGTTPNNYLYRGEQYDPDLDLYYLRARYYNPLAGRFMSRDPGEGDALDPRTLHKYLYAGGDPTNAIDPNGRVSILETGAIDRDFILEVAPKVVIVTCLSEELLASTAQVAKAALYYAFHKKKETVPDPPLWLDAACALVLLPAAVKELWSKLLELSGLYF